MNEYPMGGPIPYGFCHCGCGRPTRISDRTDPKSGAVKGEPRRFLRGHGYMGAGGSRYAVEDRGHTTPCWIWQRTLNNMGYGMMGRHGRLVLAHRAFYEVARGPIPAGLVIDHLCRNPSCVNPDHLEPVTQAENLRRGRRHAVPQTHCKRGHEFTPENTILIRGRRGRRCRECQRACGRAYKRRKSAERQAAA